MQHSFFTMVCMMMVIANGLFFPFAASAEKHAIVICGSGGTDEYIQKFSDWGRRLINILIDDLRFADSNVTFFSADIHDITEENAIACDLNILDFHFDLLSDMISEKDDIYLFMIGHGSYLQKEVTFHLPGKDLTAAIMNQWLSKLAAQNIIVVNGSSSSAGFINTISNEKRVICTSTKNVSENNAPEFMEYFIQSITDGSADVNRDERITVFEACSQAAVLTQAWYDREGYIATEHALLDDNGDGLGSRLIPEAGENDVEEKPPIDGKTAQSIFLKDYQFPKNAPIESINEYLQTLESIHTLKRSKDTLNPSLFYQQLESNLIQAASLHHFIRSFASE